MGWYYEGTSCGDELVKCHRCGEEMYPTLKIAGDRETGEERVMSEKCSTCGKWPYPPEPFDWREFGLTWGLVVLGWVIVWIVELSHPHLLGLGLLALCVCWLRALWESFVISLFAILVVSIAVAVIYFAV